MARHKRRRATPLEPTPLPVIYHPRMPHQTDAQYAASRRDDEERAKVEAALQMLARLGAAHLGYLASCPQAACRRARRCVGQMRPGDPFAHLRRVFPPCCDAPEKMESVRLLWRSRDRGTGEAGGHDA